MVERMSGSAWEYLRFARTNSARIKGDDWTKPITGQLIAIAPHSPSAHAYWLSDRWAKEKTQATELRSRFQEPSSIDMMIARNAREDKDYDAAIAALERVLTFTNDAAMFSALADVYLDKGDEVQWAETLKRSLRINSNGWASHPIQVKLVYYFLRKKDDPYSALSFARDAANTYSYQGLQCLAEVLGELAEWEEAEEVTRKRATRYSKLGYYAGLFLELSGAESQAIKYYELGTRPHWNTFSNPTIALSTVKLRGLKQRIAK
jgi:tetratricopeptide (TPR) repeat protein